MLEKLVTQLPSAVAIIIVVALFIKFLTLESKLNREFFKDLHDEHMDQRQLSRTSMDRMVEITEKNISSTMRNTVNIEVLTKAIERSSEQTHTHHK